MSKRINYNKRSKTKQSKDNTAKDELVKDELVKDELVKDELVKDELVKDEIVKDEIVKDEIVKDELVKDEIVTEKRIIKSDGSPIATVNENSQGDLVLTEDDKAKLEAVKALQATAAQAKIDAKAAIEKAKEAIQALNGSEAIKAIKLDIEARLKAQEALTSKALTEYQAAKDKLNDIQSEYQALTGVTKKIKTSNGKTSNGNGNGNGKFDTAPITIDDSGSLNILVTHKATQSAFKDNLNPTNGSIARTDWLKLRHSLTAQFERDTSEENLTIRAYLSNLKTKIEAVKSIV